MDSRQWVPGCVVTVKDSFGFIKPAVSLPEGFVQKDVHFHQRVVLGPEVQQGTEVEFQLYPNSLTKPAASKVKRLGQEVNDAPRDAAGQVRRRSVSTHRSRSRTRYQPGLTEELKVQQKTQVTAKDRHPQRRERGFRLFFQGNIRNINIEKNFGYAKPTQELPDGYPTDRDVQFQVNKVHTAGMILKLKDKLEFTLGTQDKSNPKGFNLKLVECAERSNEEISAFLETAVGNLTQQSAAACSVPMDAENKENDDQSSSRYLVDLLTCPAVWQCIGRCPSLTSSTTRTCLILLQEIIQTKSLRQNVAAILEAFIRTPIMENPAGMIMKLLDQAIRSQNKKDIDLVQSLFLTVFKLLPERAHSLIPLIKPMITLSGCDTPVFLYTALKEVTKRLNNDINDMAWDELPLVPAVCELTGGPLESTVNLRPVKVKGPYESPHEYMDINFRLLRADSFHSLRTGIRNYLEGKLDHRDMNIYQNIQLKGLQTTQSEGGLVILLKVTPFKKVTDWSRSSNLMFGNLLCISPSGNFGDPIWVTVVNRDVKMLAEKSIIMVSLCGECNPMSDADAVVLLSQLGQNAVIAESPTYYRAYQPVLKALQVMDPELLPLQDALVKGEALGPPSYLLESTTIRDPHFIYSPPYQVLGDIGISRFVASLASKHVCLDPFQREALVTGLFSRLSIIQGPPGTGKTYIGIKLLQTIQSMSTKPPGPILTLTYKNHALDEFLKPLVTAYPDEVVRVGGRSKDPELESVNMNEILRDARKTRELQERIRDKYAEIDAIRPKVTHSVKLLDNAQRFNILTLLDYANENQIVSLLGNFSLLDPILVIGGQRIRTENFIKQCFKELKFQGVLHLLRYPKQAEEKYKLLSVLAEKALAMWVPNKAVFQTLEKRMAHIQLSLSTEEPMDVESEEFDVDQEDIEAKEQERLASFSQVKANQKDVISFAEHDNDDFKPWLLSCAEQSLSQFPVARLMMMENVWEMAEEERVVFIQALLLKQAEEPRREFEQNLKHYQQLCCEKNELDDQQKAGVLVSKKIIGMTITGASIHHDLLARVKPAIVVIEEAAEVLEPQVLAVLGPWVQHLILIGDHKQLRPQVESFELCRKFNFDVSLMERLINNKYEHSTLGFQNRMRKEFADLLLDIYPNLKSNEEQIAKNCPPACIENSMYFWNHSDPETAARSCSNELEAERVVMLALFLLQQGYKVEQITLLCAYQGQVALVRKKLQAAEKNYPNLFPDEDEVSVTQSNAGVRKARIKVHTIDLFQGDENDIVIVSLVRSYSGKLRGFLNTLNRRCVAQSRARCGMYFVGNAELLSTNKNWNTLITQMKAKGTVGSGITLRCPKHLHSTFTASKASDIHLGTFCREPCSEIMCCGKHMCIGSCQPPHSHSYCSRKVPYKFPNCSHSTVKECSKDIRTLKCKHTCESKMACNMHACNKMCGDYHSHKFCIEYIEFNFPHCNHRGEKMCSDPIDSLVCKENILIQIASCKHFATKMCFQDDSKVRCKEKCTKLLHCGHMCSMKCGEPCAQSNCKDCEKIRKVTEEQKRKLEEQERKEAAKRFCLELEELRKTPLDATPMVNELLPQGDTAAEYYKVVDMVQKYIQPTHKWYPRVTKIEKVHNTKLRMNWLNAGQKLFDCTHSELKFHGTTMSAALSIINEGFRLPSSGGMYGKGIYFATDSSKSAQNIYTKGSNILLLCDVLLGRTKTVESAAPHITSIDLIAGGYDSLYAKRGTKDTKGVLYDEFVVYNPAQALPKYLIHYETVNPDAQLNLSALTASIGTGLKKDIIKPRRQMDINDPLDIHFRIAESQFLRLMSRTGKTNQITSVELYTNPILMAKFNKMKDVMKKKYPNKPEADPILAFHGTKIVNIQSIVASNFDLSRLSQNTGNRGWYGAGIYFSELPEVSIGYGGCNSILLCEVLPGRSYTCTQKMTGAPLMANFDSHIVNADSEGRGRELVIFNADQILPRYVINFN